MSKKIKKVIIAIIVICILILILDISLLIKHQKSKKEKIVPYFDSINSFEKIEDGYIAVGSNTNNKQGFEKAKITRYNENKDKVWETIVNKRYNSSFFSVRQDGEEFIAVGDYEENKEQHKEKVRSAFIAKYNAEGKLLKEQTFKVLDHSKFSKVLVVEDGYLVVGQSIYENMTLGFSDEGGAILIKYDKNLKEVWKVNYGGSKSAIYNDLLLLGDYIYTVGKDSTRTGIVSKYTVNGDRILTTNYDSTDTIGFSSIVNIKDKLYIIGSKTMNSDSENYDTDALIVMYDMNGNYISENRYGGKGIERYNSAIVDNENIIIVGQEGIIEEKKKKESEKPYTYYGIFAKYDESLKEIEINNYGDDMDDYFTDIKQVNGKYIVSGYSLYEDNNYLPKFITYTKNGKVIGAK